MNDGALHELPGGWVWTRLEDACNELIGGGTPSRKIPEYFGGNIIWLTPTEVPKNKIIILKDSKEKITESGLNDSSARIIPKDSVLLTSRASIGYVAIAGCDVTTNQGFASFVCSNAIYNFFLAYWLWANKRLLESNATGTTFKEISKSKLREFYLPLPPLPEQRAIVSKIEQLFSDLDNGINNFKKAQAQLKRYRQSVLKAACEGKLVPTEAELARAEGREYEAADVLLARILRERREKSNGKSKYKEPAAPDTGGLPELPKGWYYTYIVTLLSIDRTGIKTGPFGSLLKKHEHRIEGIPVLGIENIEAMKFIAGSKIHITKEKSNQLSGYDALTNDVLISRSGTVGEVCVVPEGLGEARISTNLMRVTLAPNGMLPLFFTFLFNGSPFVLDQVTELCKGSTRNFLNQDILFSLIFPLPPLAEQRRIVAEIGRRLSICDKMEATIAESLQKAESLRQSILKKAFEGKLLNEKELKEARNAPDWEPAEKLLERIRQEKQIKEKNNKSTRRKVRSY